MELTSRKCETCGAAATTLIDGKCYLCDPWTHMRAQAGVTETDHPLKVKVILLDGKGRNVGLEFETIDAYVAIGKDDKAHVYAANMHILNQTQEEHDIKSLRIEVTGLPEEIFMTDRAFISKHYSCRMRPGDVAHLEWGTDGVLEARQPRTGGDDDGPG